MKILVVDDNEALLQVLGDLLREHGYEVFLASDGKQARETIESETIDLVISDVFMPVLDGMRFHSYVREFSQSADVPFIFVSGYDDEQTRNVIEDPKKDFFFHKTAPFEHIITLIDKLKRSEPRVGQHQANRTL
jgi:DNA-binding response OmpR family regulator